MSAPRRILHLVTRLELGGAQQNTLFSCRSQTAAGHQVTLVAGPGGLLEADAANLSGVEFHPLPSLVHPINPFRDYAALNDLTRLFRARRPDLVHTHSSKAGILGREAAARAGVPVVVHTVHGWSFHPGQSPFFRQVCLGLEKRAAHQTTTLVTVSDHDRQTGLALGIGKPEQYRTIRSGIDWAGVAAAAPHRATVRSALGLAPDEPMVLMVACLKPQKAPLEFVRLAAALPGPKFFLAGDGELRPAVAAAAAGLGNRFTLLGWRRDVPDLLAAADALVLTSRWEGLPRAVVEALALGTPAVATDTGGVREVIAPEGEGFIVPPGDLAALTEKVTTVLGWPRTVAARQRRATAAEARLRGEFDFPRMGEQLLALYAGAWR